ncbi:hypothetical protein ACOALZ_07705 [Nocardiopsis algeriensis]
MFSTTALGEAEETTCHGEEPARYGHSTFCNPKAEFAQNVRIY